MKILLFGGRGQVGWELQRALAPLGSLVVPSSAQVDLSQPEIVRHCVETEAPTVIVNAAGYTAVDRAEHEPERVHAINAVAPGLLAGHAAEIGATLVHYSTDYVFDGSGDRPRDEDAEVGPLNVYGRSKLAGELAIRASGCRHLILRTSWVYAAHGANFAKTVLRLATEREQLEVVRDQIGAPTGAELLADVSAHALCALRSDPTLAGTYHCAASGETNWYDYARLIVARARDRGRPVKVSADQIRPVASRDYPTPARRPLNSRLATGRLQQAFGLTLPHWRPGVERMLDEILLD